MKTKIALIILTAAALVSFTVVSTKQTTVANPNQSETYHSSNGQVMADKNQFN